jgi:hypothetical protein
LHVVGSDETVSNDLGFHIVSLICHTRHFCQEENGG